MPSKFRRKKEIPPGSGNSYYYDVISYPDGSQEQSYVGPVDEYPSRIPEKQREQSSEENDTEEEEEASSGMNEEAVKELTRQGTMVERDAAEILTEEDVELIKDLETTPMYVSESMVLKLREQNDIDPGEPVPSDGFDDVEYSEVQMITDVPSYTGTDGKVYPETSEGDIVEVPSDNAEILVNRGNAEYMNKDDRWSPDPAETETEQEDDEEEENEASEESDEYSGYDQSDEFEGLKIRILTKMPEDEEVKTSELKEDIGDDDFDEALESLKREGAVFEPRQGYVHAI